MLLHFKYVWKTWKIPKNLCSCTKVLIDRIKFIYIHCHRQMNLAISYDIPGVMISPMIFVLILLICFFCNNLTHALENLMYSVMHSNWINKMLLIILMENLKKSMTINFHETYDINLETFVNIVQKAWIFIICCSKN